MTKDKITELSETDLDAVKGAGRSGTDQTARDLPGAKEAFASDGGLGTTRLSTSGKTGIIASDEGETI